MTRPSHVILVIGPSINIDSPHPSLKAQLPWSLFSAGIKIPFDFVIFDVLKLTQERPIELHLTPTHSRPCTYIPFGHSTFPGLLGGNITFLSFALIWNDLVGRPHNKANSIQPQALHPKFSTSIFPGHLIFHLLVLVNPKTHFFDWIRIGSLLERTVKTRRLSNSSRFSTA